MRFDMRFLCLALSLLLACEARAQQVLEVIELKHATVQQVLPALQPLLEPGGALTGQYNQLIVRASPANVAEIRRALEAIDRAPRRLQISVRFDDSLDASRQAVETSGRIGNRGGEVDVRARDSQARSDERVDQRVQVLEGGRAFIAAGQSRPTVQRRAIQTPAGTVGQDTFVVQQAVTGFEVAPRVSGDRVFLDIAPQRESFDRQGGVQGQRLSSTVSARLGEWFEIGGSASDAARDERGLASASRSRTSESRRVWVKVEEIRN
jgi:hypothetical protein